MTQLPHGSFLSHCTTRLADNANTPVELRLTFCLRRWHSKQEITTRLRFRTAGRESICIFISPDSGKYPMAIWWLMFDDLISDELTAAAPTRFDCGLLLLLLW